VAISIRSQTSCHFSDGLDYRPSAQGVAHTRLAHFVSVTASNKWCFTQPRYYAIANRLRRNIFQQGTGAVARASPEATQRQARRVVRIRRDVIVKYEHGDEHTSVGVRDGLLGDVDQGSRVAVARRRPCRIGSAPFRRASDAFPSVVEALAGTIVVSRDITVSVIVARSALSSASSHCR
jgi:hypothetical protein